MHGDCGRASGHFNHPDKIRRSWSKTLKTFRNDYSNLIIRVEIYVLTCKYFLITECSGEERCISELGGGYRAEAKSWVGIMGCAITDM